MALEDDSLMPFGSHKGKQMIDVPADYLLWLFPKLQKEFKPNLQNKEVLKYINENMEVLKKEEKDNLTS